MGRLSRREGVTRGDGATPVGWPQREQNAALSSIWRPHLVQNITLIRHSYRTQNGAGKFGGSMIFRRRLDAPAAAVGLFTAYKTDSNAAAPGSPANAAPGTASRASPAAGRSFCCDRAAGPLPDPAGFLADAHRFATRAPPPAFSPQARSAAVPGVADRPRALASRRTDVRAPPRSRRTVRRLQPAARSRCRPGRHVIPQLCTDFGPWRIPRAPNPPSAAPR